MRTYLVNSTNVSEVQIHTIPLQVGEEEGRVAELHDLNLGAQSAVVKKMLTPVTLGLPEIAYHFSADLYYYKVSVYFFINS